MNTIRTQQTNYVFKLRTFKVGKKSCSSRHIKETRLCIRPDTHVNSSEKNIRETVNRVSYKIHASVVPVSRHWQLREEQ